MKQIFVIAQDEMTPCGEIETRICFNFGAYQNIQFAAQKAIKLNLEMEDPDEEGEYYVRELKIVDAPEPPEKP